MKQPQFFVLYARDDEDSAILSSSASERVIAQDARESGCGVVCQYDVAPDGETLVKPRWRYDLTPEGSASR